MRAESETELWCLTARCPISHNGCWFIKKQDGGHGSRNPLKSVHDGCYKTWGVSPGEVVVGADLGGSSKYSNENFEGRRGERFHVNGTCTWPAHPGNGSARGRVQWLKERRTWRNARQEMSLIWIHNLGKRIGSEGWARGSQLRTRRLSVDGSSCSRGESGSSCAGRGTDWEWALRGPYLGQETTAKGIGLVESAGKEDPVELTLARLCEMT
ncbi:atp synthase subunit beta [Senna tora]|uniref:Atp synthase subunit beta n=1 Tax=Senna tora TaxID=362788 RepID=A0A834WGA5_9FABA|nr:atp synthase subunit beta [Senna tora]